jgi:hypothetical protein
MLPTELPLTEGVLEVTAEELPLPDVLPMREDESVELGDVEEGNVGDDDEGGEEEGDVDVEEEANAVSGRAAANAMMPSLRISGFMILNK